MTVTFLQQQQALVDSPQQLLPLQLAAHVLHHTSVTGFSNKMSVWWQKRLLFVVCGSERVFTDNSNGLLHNSYPPYTICAEIAPICSPTLSSSQKQAQHKVGNRHHRFFFFLSFFPIVILLMSNFLPPLVPTFP